MDTGTLVLIGLFLLFWPLDDRFDLNLFNFFLSKIRKK